MSALISRHLYPHPDLQPGYQAPALNLGEHNTIQPYFHRRPTLPWHLNDTLAAMNGLAISTRLVHTVSELLLELDSTVEGYFRQVLSPIRLICRYNMLRRYPSVFLQMTDLRLNEFAELLTDIILRFAAYERR